MSHPELGRSLCSTLAAAPAASFLIYLQVVWLGQMAIAANIGYVHGLADAFHGKAHRGFSCFKAGPHYQ